MTTDAAHDAAVSAETHRDMGARWMVNAAGADTPESALFAVVREAAAEPMSDAELGAVVRGAVTALHGCWSE